MGGGGGPLGPPGVMAVRRGSHGHLPVFAQSATRTNSPIMAASTLCAETILMVPPLSRPPHGESSWPLMTWMRDDRAAGVLTLSVRVARFPFLLLRFSLRKYASSPLQPVGVIRPEYAPASLGPFGPNIGTIGLDIDDIKSFRLIFHGKYVIEYTDGLESAGLSSSA